MEKVIKKSKVYYVKNADSTSLIKAYNFLNRQLKGDVAVKLTAETIDLKFKEIVEPFICLLNGTIVDNNSNIIGANTNKLMQELKQVGLTDLAPVDILDGEGYDEFLGDTTSGVLLNKLYVGKHLKDYNSFAGITEVSYNEKLPSCAISSLALGLTSKEGKSWVLSSGFSGDVDVNITNVAGDNLTIKAIAESAKMILDYITNRNVIFVNILKNKESFNLFISTDPVAVDKASFDVMKKQLDLKRFALTNKWVNSFENLTKEATLLGIGDSNYELVNIN